MVNLKESNALLAKQIAKLESLLSESALEARELLRFIQSEGYRRCDIEACNCGSWHCGHAHMRLREISEALDDRTQGTTILSAVRRLILLEEAEEKP